MVDVEVIKRRLRINHNRLDEQFEQDIQFAKDELVRVGVSSEMVESEEDSLIDEAIISYCMMIENSVDSKMYDAYEKQWIQRRDELRKSTKYKAEYV